MQIQGISDSYNDASDNVNLRFSIKSKVRSQGSVKQQILQETQGAAESGKA